MPTYTVLGSPFDYTADPIKGSRFVAHLAPCTTEDEAMAHVRSVEATAPDASHHCWAWLLADGRSRSFDAGEPRGSAGRPILAQIEGHGVVDVAAVVSRWFGGTKLGVGGLIRAYGGTAGKALDRAPLVERASRATLVITHAYDDTGTVQAIVGAHHLVVVNTRWDALVSLTIELDEDQLEAILVEVRDRTSGRARAEVLTSARP